MPKQTLREKINVLSRIANTYAEGVVELQQYLDLPKFRGLEDAWVNPDDIRLRLAETNRRVTALLQELEND